MSAAALRHRAPDAWWLQHSAGRQRPLRGHMSQFGAAIGGEALCGLKGCCNIDHINTKEGPHRCVMHFS